jgi:hypothetical protein
VHYNQQAEGREYNFKGKYPFSEVRFETPEGIEQHLARDKIQEGVNMSES